MNRAPAALLIVAASAVLLVAASSGGAGTSAGAEPLCESHSGVCPDTLTHKNYEGDYVGHDEPALLFYSSQAGSGNSNVWHLRIPRDAPVAPKQDGTGGTWNFQLRPTFWFGMALCESQSYPNPGVPCTPDSDANIKNSSDPSSPNYIGNHVGSGFLELQFYPPGYVQQFTGFSCKATQWCAAMAVFGLSDSLTQPNNADCFARAGEEWANFAYLTTNGVPQGPPDPLNFEFVGSGTPGPNVLYMNPGDEVVVSIHDSAAGLVTTVNDVTTGQTGSMTASVANGFAHPLFQPNASTCTEEPYAFHPMYSTSSEDTRVPWAAHSYNVSFSDEIGHFEFCDRVNPHGDCVNPGVDEGKNNKKDADDSFCFDGSASLLVQVGACLNSDIDFDGASYQAVWPGSSTNATTEQQLHPQSFVVTSPLTGGQNYSRMAFEADLPAIEFATGCDTSTGSGCVNPPPGAAFYPLYTTTGTGGACAWREGGTHMPGTTNTFGGSSTTEYGPLLQLYYPAFPGGFPAGTAYEDFRQVLASNPCTSNGALP